MFQVGLPCYLGLNSGRSVSISVNKTRKHFFRNIHVALMFSQCFPVFHTENIFSRASFCFQDVNYTYPTRHGILTKIRACEHLQKFCEPEQASTYVIFQAIQAKAKFCKLFQIGWAHSIPLFCRHPENHTNRKLKAKKLGVYVMLAQPSLIR